MTTATTNQPALRAYARARAAERAAFAALADDDAGSAAFAAWGDAVAARNRARHALRAGAFSDVK